MDDNVLRRFAVLSICKGCARKQLDQTRYGGALFTFGAKADMLNTMGTFFHVVYIVSSFVGISLTALFVTMLVNVFVRYK